MKARPSQFYPILICSLAALFYTYDYFIQVAPSVMTEQLMAAFDIKAPGLGILSACFYYSYTLMQIPAGLLLDRIGPRILLTFSVCISGVGVMVFGSTQYLWLAGVGRFCIGLGSSFAFISALFLVSSWFSHRRFAMIAGFIQLAGCLGSIIGLAPLSRLIEHFGWRQTMIATGLLTFIFSFLFWAVIQENKAHKAHTQVKQEKQRLRFLLRKPQIWWLALCGLVSWMPVAGIGALWGVPYLSKVHGWTDTQAGQAVSYFWISLALGSIACGWLSDKIRSRKKPMYLCFSLGFIGAYLLYDAGHLPLFATYLGLILLGAASSVQSLSFALLKDIVPRHLFGSASGFNNMAAIIGGAIAQPLFGFLINWHWSGKMLNNVPVYTLDNYQHALLLLPIIMLIGLLTVTFALRETHCQPLVTHEAFGGIGDK